MVSVGEAALVAGEKTNTQHKMVRQFLNMGKQEELFDNLVKNSLESK